MLMSLRYVSDLINEYSSCSLFFIKTCPTPLSTKPTGSTLRAHSRSQICANACGLMIGIQTVDVTAAGQTSLRM